MKDIILTLTNLVVGIILISIGVEIFTAVYFSIMISILSCYLFILVSETKKANTDGNQ